MAGREVSLRSKPIAQRAAMNALFMIRHDLRSVFALRASLTVLTSCADAEKVSQGQDLGAMRTKREIEAAYQAVEQQLDELLGGALENLSKAGLRIRNECHRGALDQWGPGYIWSYAFEHDEPGQAQGEALRRVVVRLRYEEPWEPVPKVDVEVARTAEASDGGTEVVFRHERQERIALHNLQTRGLFSVVNEAVYDGVSRLNDRS